MANDDGYDELSEKYAALKSENLALALELEEARTVLLEANRYNANHSAFSPCDEIRYFHKVQDALSRPSPSSERAKAYMDVVEKARQKRREHDEANLKSVGPEEECDCEICKSVARLDAIELNK